MSATATATISERIFNGEFDDELDGIAEAARAREKYVRQSNALGIRVGDRVRTVENLRPKALAGLLGTVERVTTGRSRALHVKLDVAPDKWDTAYRYAPDGIMRGRDDLFVKVDAATYPKP